MSCSEKASRRLRTLVAKAKRLGVTAEEVAALPAAGKLAPRAPRGSKRWPIVLGLLALLGGGAVLALLCAPCFVRRTMRELRMHL